MEADILANPFRTHPFASLREIARSLSAAWDLDTTLDLIARKTTEVMGVNSCTIYLLDTDNQTLRLRASTGLARQALGRATLQIGEGMTGHAVARNRPIYAADAQHDPHFKWVDDTEEVRFRSLLAVPLVLDDRPIGALNVQTAEPRDYDDEEIEMLALICDLAAGALVKAQLHDRQQRQLDDLRTLAQVSEAITSPQYLDDILSVVTKLAAHTVGAVACSIYLLEAMIWAGRRPRPASPCPVTRNKSPRRSRTPPCWKKSSASDASAMRRSRKTAPRRRCWSSRSVSRTRSSA